MRLLNRQYIEVDRFSIFMEMAKELIENSKNKKRKSFFQKLLNVMSESKESNSDKVYISVDELCDQNLFSINDIPIDSGLLTCVTLIAISEDNFAVAKTLSAHLLESKGVTINDIGEDIANYIFDNCDRYDDFFSGKCTRVVYSEKENKLEERTIKPIQRANLKKLEKN